MEDWTQCETRGPWVRNSLEVKIKELRKNAVRLRKAYTKDFMNVPCQYIADAYDSAANIIQYRLDNIKE